VPYATDNLIVPVLYSFVKNMVANKMPIIQKKAVYARDERATV